MSEQPQAGELWEVRADLPGGGTRLRIVRVDRPLLHRPYVVCEERAGESRHLALDERWGKGIYRIEET